MALLKHDPTNRITYNEFFAHEFLDLEHAPTKENYDKAVALIHKAVEADTEKNTKEAFCLYCDSLRYFIPILTSKNEMFVKINVSEKKILTCMNVLLHIIIIIYVYICVYIYIYIYIYILFD